MIDWNLAPEDALGIAQRNSDLAFVGEDGHVFLNGHWGISMGWQTIATRPTQKTVADNSQASCSETERWTHTHLGDKCYVVHIDGCAAWVVLQNAGSKIIPTNSLTPIKPTMTKDEQEAIAKFIARIWKKDNPDLRVEFDAFCKEHNIT